MKTPDFSPMEGSATRAPEAVYLDDGSLTRLDGVSPSVLVVTGHASAAIEASESGSAHIHCREHARLHLRTRSARPFTLTGDGNTILDVVCDGRSVLHVHLAGAARARILARDESTPLVRSVDLSSVMVVTQERAKPRFHDWDPAWEALPADVYVGQRLCCFETLRAAVKAAEAYYAEWKRTENRFLSALRCVGIVPKICKNVVDLRWIGGIVHVETRGEGNSESWYSTDAHGHAPLLEVDRHRCTRRYFE